ncbi:RNA-binding (RRM/RBD/RNP motifs) family protein [Zea mays]|uniref:RNA-binding (RRM/RBD/RNP motifs) family protein n=1 Tax=Zea mays TaxID=4577 RepID=A0A1D6K8J1_MAIZE|nr:RNA-binding (RRM/RBD/RNP motifs) family protein [Zea mays]ONL99840.1 RNA-binding (RRM/RBD/RNP motifs) family protein [Zea mays]
MVVIKLPVVSLFGTPNINFELWFKLMRYGGALRPLPLCLACQLEMIVSQSTSRPNL